MRCWASGRLAFWAIVEECRREFFVKPNAGGFNRLFGRLVRSDELHLDLLHTPSWPHGHFRPQGLACGAQWGNRLFVAERYAVHELLLPIGTGFFSENAEEEKWHPAVQSCLQEVPKFLAAGLRSVTMRCEEECFLVLLGSTGDLLLSCPLGLGNATLAELLGGPWQAIASSASSGRGSGLWAKSHQGHGLVQLGSQRHQAQNVSYLVPLLEVDHGVPSSAEHLVALEDGTAVLGLLPNGTVLVHQLEPPFVFELRLPGATGARWSGLCSPGGRDLLLVGKTHKDRDFAIWRTHLPRWL